VRVNFPLIKKSNVLYTCYINDNYDIGYQLVLKKNVFRTNRVQNMSFKINKCLDIFDFRNVYKMEIKLDNSHIRKIR
jgi:hypothetical protein